ncbi:MAG: TolC family protein [Gemmatimonadota bacterium]|nr:TolC family protein [Gemmatimonadota bacterium]
MITRRRWWYVAVGFAVMTSCARYVPQPLEPRRDATALETRRLSDPGLARFIHTTDSAQAWPPASWSLHTLTLAGLYFNPALDVARADLGVARAAVVTAGGRPNPTLSSDVAALTHGSTTSPSVLNLIVGIPFVTAGKRGIQVRQARADAVARALDVETAAWGVRTQVRDAALEYWSAGRAVGFSSRAADGEATLVTLLRQRQVAGEASALDVGREEVALERARAAQRADQSRLAGARVQLAAAIGVPVEALDGASFDFAAFSASLPAPPERHAMRAAALLGRSDVRAALANYAGAQAALQLEVARQYPDLSLGTGLHWEQELQGLTITPAAAIPLLNRNQGPIAEADARRTAAAARFTALQAELLGQVDQALAAYATDRDAAQSADSAANAQARLAERAVSLFRAGEFDRVDLESARVAAALGRHDAVAARTTALAALGALESTTQVPQFGGSWHMPDVTASADRRGRNP